MTYLYHYGVSPRAPWVDADPIERSTPIRTGPTTAIPSLFRATVDDRTQPFILEFKVQTVGGRRPEVVELTLVPRDPIVAGGVTTEGLRSVQVAKALKLALAKATKRVNEMTDGLFQLEGDGPGIGYAGSQVARPVRGEPVSEDFLRQVADTYRKAVASGSRRPVGELGEQLGGSRSTAGRWVVQARRAGFLRAAVGRTAGEAPPRRSKKRKG
jgi:hypothetical protein